MTRAATPTFADRNKTELTLRVTESASAWLSGLGAKCVETEVFVGPKWLADLAAFWSPTPTEATNAKLIPPRIRYPYGESPEKMERYKSHEKARTAAFGALPDRITIVHEVKTSRADFANDKKWKRERVADMQVLSYTSGTVGMGELPNGWWALEHSAESGALLKVQHREPIHDTSLDQRLMVIANIAERRHNRTANQYLSDLQKSWCKEAAARRIDGRLGSCIRLVLEIAHGQTESVESSLRGRFEHKISEHLLSELKKLHGVLKETAG